jgi:putative ABC transport system permease protein
VRRSNLGYTVRASVAGARVTRDLADAFARVDPTAAFAFRRMDELVRVSVSQERLLAMLSGAFGALALVLAALGLYGVTSYSVSQRRAEIGIRMALGAQRRDVLRLVMGESMTLVVIGVGLGLAAAVAASRLVVTLVFGLAATDAVTMLTAMTALIVVSALAGYLPARRAARVDPLVALHYE